MLMLWPLAVTPGVTHVGAYHRPSESDGHFSKLRGRTLQSDRECKDDGRTHEFKCVANTQCALQQMHNMFCNKHTMCTRLKYTMCLQQIYNIICNQYTMCTRHKYTMCTRHKCTICFATNVHNVHYTMCIGNENSQQWLSLQIDTISVAYFLFMYTYIYTHLNALTILGTFSVLKIGSQGKFAAKHHI